MVNINFKVTHEEAKTISAIVERIQTMCRKMDATYDPLEASMDLTATHANDCRLDLKGLLEADNFNFAHDVFGIKRHINRETGKLENCFLPRLSQKD